MTSQLQLDLDIEGRRCPSCGSDRHHGCGFDPEMVKPAMSVAEALSATISNAIETHGWEEATKRLPGLVRWGSAEHRQAVEGMVAKLMDAGYTTQEIEQIPDLLSLTPAVAGLLDGGKERS